MTNRLPYDRHWGSDGAAFVVDPETDAGHPSGQGGAGKTAKGWVTESEPHEWENYRIKLNADRQLALMQLGNFQYDVEVTYKLGAITVASGIRYVSLQGNNLNHAPASSPAWWSEIKFKTAAEFSSIVSGMVSAKTTHATPGVIAHGETIGQVGGETKSYIGNGIAAVNSTLLTHAARVDNPHDDTALEIGTIPTTGGDFTGQVNYIDGLVVGTTCELMSNADTFVAFKSLAGAIGIGIADYSKGGRWQCIFTEGNYATLNSAHTVNFTLPEPDLHFALMTHLNAQSVGTGTLALARPTTLAYTDKSNVAQTAPVDMPAFERLGIKLAANQTVSISAPGLLGCTEGCIAYTLNDVLFVKDIHFTSDSLESYVGVLGNIKNFRVWSKRLTPRQKLSIPK